MVKVEMTIKEVEFADSEAKKWYIANFHLTETY